MKTKSRKAKPAARPLTFAGKPCTKEQISATVRLLRYYRRFLASPEHDRCKSPEQWGIYYTKAEARRRLYYLVEMAINRKAGIPDETQAERDEFFCLWRDARAIQEIRTRRLRVFQFETGIARRRFSHILARYDD